jgi:hypothetical protein
MKKTVRIIDPPSGWMYGFPKEIPSNIKDIKKWIVDEGYPEKDLEMLKYCRYWNKSVDMTADEIEKAIGEYHSFEINELLEMDMNINEFMLSHVRKN